VDSPPHITKNKLMLKTDADRWTDRIDEPVHS